MTKLGKLTSILLASAIYAGLSATPATAQATRTWVSGVGDDVNPCSRTAPCKTFAGAISKTAPGGEIDCLDPGGFGAVTITKSITIDCTGTLGGVLNSLTNGINVNDSASGFPNSIRVILRGITIDGAQTGVQNASGNPGSGLTGINFISGASLVVEDVVIQNQNGTTSVGLRFAPSGSATLSVGNSLITDNGSTGVGGGILIQPTGASGTARVSIRNTRIVSNINNGVFVNTTGATGANGVTVVIRDSEISNNTGNGVNVLQPAGTQNVGLMINGSEVSGNSATGINAAGGGTTLRVDGTSITGNATGVASASGAQILSYGGNQLDGNPTVGAANNGAFTGAIIPRR